jgi:hypothetical protein
MSDSIQPYILAFILGVVMIVLGSTMQSLAIGAVGGLVLLVTTIMLLYNSTRN